MIEWIAGITVFTLPGLFLTVIFSGHIFVMLDGIVGINIFNHLTYLIYLIPYSHQGLVE